MGVMLIADKLGETRFGLVPKHPVIKGIKVVGLRPGKVYPDETFEWHSQGYDWRGGVPMPPTWASPTCDEGRKLYAEADKARAARAAARGGKQRPSSKVRTKIDLTSVPGAGPKAPRVDRDMVPGAGPAPPSQS